MYIETAASVDGEASNGKKRTPWLLVTWCFLGEEVLSGRVDRPDTATAHDEDDRAPGGEARDDPAPGHAAPAVGAIIAHMLAVIPPRADLIDSVVYSCEKRVARTLMLLPVTANATVMPNVSQE